MIEPAAPESGESSPIIAVACRSPRSTSAGASGAKERSWGASPASPITAPAVVESPPAPVRAVPSVAVTWPITSILSSPGLSAERVMTSSAVASTEVVVEVPAGNRTVCSDRVTAAGSSKVAVRRASTCGVP